MPISENPNASNETTTHLEKMGHPLKLSSTLAIAQGIQNTDRGLLAVSDPRTDGQAISVP